MTGQLVSCITSCTRTNACPHSVLSPIRIVAFFILLDLEALHPPPSEEDGWNLVDVFIFTTPTKDFQSFHF